MHLLAQMSDTSQADGGVNGFWLTVVAVVIGISGMWIGHLYLSRNSAIDEATSATNKNMRDLIEVVGGRIDGVMEWLQKLERKHDEEVTRQREYERQSEARLCKLEATVDSLIGTINHINKGAA